MPGPVSTPMGDKSFHDELNEIVCDVHYNCGMEKFDKNGKQVKHDFITYRVWLAKRHRLRTGKSL